jgi:surface protein
MASMFNAATNFNNGGGSALTFNTGNVTLMTSMFQSATAFNRDITSWSTIKVTSMASMFQSATAFNNGQTSGTTGTNPLNWNTGAVTSMANMFNAARNFNQAISNWDTSKVTTMVSMFQGVTTIANTTRFNNGQASGTVPGTAPLNWNTSNVTTMANMFRYCISFNQNITKSGSNWDTSKLTTLASIFEGINGTTGLHLFNNSEGPGGVTAPMGWTFTNPPTSTTYRTNSNLSNTNKPASLP